jgi:hypothetical protein
MRIKSCWVATHPGSCSTLTIESGNPSEKDYRISAHDLLFPAMPSPEHPLRHTINLGVFDDEDLQRISDVILGYLNSKG